jgi:cold shock CspA family protein
MDRNAARLLAEKVARELYRIAQAYGKQHPFDFDDLVHDLGVMLERDGLQVVSLKFYRPNGSRDVLAEYNYALHAGTPRLYLDDAQGLGVVPISPPFEMGLVVRRDPQAGAYEGRLRLSWGDAPDYARRGGFEHQDGNTAHRTGGRASKHIYMDDTLRRQGRVKFFLPAKQYGFITCADGVDVFFHLNNVQGFQPRQGQPVTFLPLATPRGVQAKDVRPA